jgi:Lrp/AsnC family transcriptional regulator, leucine-responsive regulatory protein
VPGNRRLKAADALDLPERLLDAVNLKLLRALHRDPRQSTAALARVVGMSAPAVTERLQRLRDAGVIAGFELRVDPAALGLPITAYVRIRPVAGQLARVAEVAVRTPEVVECHRITGDDCFLVKVHVPAVDALESVLDRFGVYGQTTTSIVQSSPVPPRLPPLPDERARTERPTRRE